MQFVVIHQAAEQDLTVQNDELCALAEWLRCHDSIPSCYLASTAAEAQATANWLCTELGGDPPTTTQTLEVLTPGGQTPSLKHLASYVPVVEGEKADGGVIAIIGTEPRLQALVHAMTADWHRPLEPAQALLLEKGNWARHEAGKVNPQLRSPAPRTPDQAASPTASTRYDTISSSIRATDDISFKLLGLVPLLSGVGILALLRAPEDPRSSAGMAFFAVFAALITFALYRWELRNIQNCTWFRERLADIERDEFGLFRGQYLLQPDPPKLSILGRPVRIGRWSKIDKTKAEVLLYGTTISAWIILAFYGAIRTLVELRG